MRTNKLNITPPSFTHEGARAANINPEQQLRRSVMSCLLFEKEFYESGEAIASRIKSLVQVVQPAKVAAIAIEARQQMHLRHIPLYLVACMGDRARGTDLISRTLNEIVQRPDELSEFLAIYCKAQGLEMNATPSQLKPHLSNQVRKGLAAAFTKFSAYSLAKYNRDTSIKLRDVMFLCHPKPKNEDQKVVWEKLINGTLEAPDTWEVALSSGADKKATFERLLTEGKLGYFALLRNLRNMEQAGCDPELVKKAILARENGADKILPFRFVAAARAAMSYEPQLDQSMLAAIDGLPALQGNTVVLVDVSDSMNDKLSEKSDLKRMDAAAALASIIKGSRRVFTFSNQLVEVPPRMGMAGIDVIQNSQPHNSTQLYQAIDALNKLVKYDRLIVITDEQVTAQQGWDHKAPSCPAPTAKGYMINVASAHKGVGYGQWTHIDGFSENVIRWIVEHENLAAA